MQNIIIHLLFYPNQKIKVPKTTKIYVLFMAFLKKMHFSMLELQAVSIT